jgi:NAD(P)-dependent dehydrogenase (short-subunit alcohol dehydrogenase family)
VRDAEAVAEAADSILGRLGPPEVVVAAAGTVAIAPIEELDPEAFRATVETNLLGTFHLFRAFLPAMKAAGRGRLVPVLSVAATRGFPGWSAYCASKWGVRGLVAALREELAGTGVLITALYPGATATGLWDEVPGEWDRSPMVPVEEVARSLVHALDVGEPALVEEIHLGPAGGAL